MIWVRYCNPVLANKKRDVNYRSLAASVSLIWCLPLFRRGTLKYRPLLNMCCSLDFGFWAAEQLETIAIRYINHSARIVPKRVRAILLFEYQILKFNIETITPLIVGNDQNKLQAIANMGELCYFDEWWSVVIVSCKGAQSLSEYVKLYKTRLKHSGISHEMRTHNNLFAMKWSSSHPYPKSGDLKHYVHLFSIFIETSFLFLNQIDPSLNALSWRTWRLSVKTVIMWYPSNRQFSVEIMDIVHSMFYEWGSWTVTKKPHHKLVRGVFSSTNSLVWYHPCRAYY